jgi:hypothetical protein
MKIHPDLRKPLRAARKQGWTLEQTKGGHLRAVPPAGLLDPRTGLRQGVIIIAATPSDGHATKNARADLRRAGVTW